MLITPPEPSSEDLGGIFFSGFLSVVEAAPPGKPLKHFNDLSITGVSLMTLTLQASMGNVIGN
jgi:hypothetical protein